MALLREVRRRARHILGPVLWLAIAGYFSYHAVSGERSLLVWLQLNQQITEARNTAQSLAGERWIIEKRVALLRPDNLDPDMLEERVRIMLGLARDDEVVIFDAP